MSLAVESSRLHDVDHPGCVLTGMVDGRANKPKAARLQSLLNAWNSRMRANNLSTSEVYLQATSHRQSARYTATLIESMQIRLITEGITPVL
jgi:hypothetical protein